MENSKHYKTIRNERKTILYAIILFFILINLFFMPKNFDEEFKLAQN